MDGLGTATGMWRYYFCIHRTMAIAKKFYHENPINFSFFSLLTHLQGSVLKKHPHHSHFRGTIQVMKAVANHLVLTFCEQSELFTIILTRTKSIAVDVSINLPFSPLTLHEITISIYVIICVYLDDKMITIIDFFPPFSHLTGHRVYSQLTFASRTCRSISSRALSL